MKSFNQFVENRETFEDYVKNLKDDLLPVYTAEQKTKALELIDLILNKGGVATPIVNYKAWKALEELKTYITKREYDYLCYELRSAPTSVRFGHSNKIGHGGRPEDFDHNVKSIQQRIATAKVINI